MDKSIREALKSSVALQGTTVSPDVAPVVSGNATTANIPAVVPFVIGASGTNEPQASKRALAWADSGIAIARDGDSSVDTGQQLVAAAIVDLYLNGYKWTPADARTVGQDTADMHKGKLAQYRSDCVAVFLLKGEKRPTDATNTMGMIAARNAKAAFVKFQRDQYHYTCAANLALCIMANGGALRDFNAKESRWELLGAQFCEDGERPVDSKARWAFMRCRTDADFIPTIARIDGKDEPSHAARSMANYIDLVCTAHGLLYKSPVAIARKEERAAEKQNRAPHHNDMSKPTGARPNATPNATPPVAPTSGNTTTPNTTPVELPTLPLPTGDAPPVSAPVPVVPFDVVATVNKAMTETLDTQIQSVRLAMLHLCEAKTAADVDRRKLTTRIGKGIMTENAWNAWLDIVKLAVEWNAIHNHDKAPLPKHIVRQTDTVIDGVTLSTATKAAPRKRAGNKPAEMVA